MRLLLVEDDEVITRELQLHWRRAGWALQTAGSLAAASAVRAQGGIDLIVLDLGLPDGDGLAWLAMLRSTDRQTPVLVLTARDQVSDRVRGLQTGADDYLVKPFAVDELDARIEVLARRAQMARGDLALFATLSWRGSEGSAYADGQRLDLSPREFEVLGLLVRRAPRMVPKRALIEALAERNLEVGDSAVEVYVSRLRRKLVGSGTAIRTLRGFGYVLDVEADEPAGTADPR
jgi:two-component system response regulator TctD